MWWGGATVPLTQKAEAEVLEPRPFILKNIGRSPSLKTQNKTKPQNILYTDYVPCTEGTKQQSNMEAVKSD